MTAEPPPPPAQAAPSPPTARDPAEAGDDATTPLPIQTQIQLKPSYTFESGDTDDRAETLFEPTLPYDGFLVPGLEATGFWSIARLQITAESLQDRKGPSSGRTDLTLTDVVAHQLGPRNVALGYATLFPTATSTALGQGQWQLGPAAAVRLESVPQRKIAALVQNFYSVAGSSQSPDLEYVTVQPFVTLHLPAALFLSSDAQRTFYGRGGQSTVPVDLGFGGAFNDRFVGTLRGFYTAADADRDAVKVEIVQP